MKAFQLAAKTQAKLVKATPHKEFDGKNPMKQAISLKLRATLSLLVLRQINPHLPERFMRRRDDADVQQPVEGVVPVVLEAVAPEEVLPITFSCEYTGYTVAIDRVLGDIELYGCSVSKIKVTELIPEGEQGMAVIEWSIGSDEKITPELVGLLCSMEGDDIWLGQRAPDKPEAEIKAAKKAQKKKEELEAAGQKRIDDAAGQTGEQPQTPEGALAAAVGADASIPQGGGAGAGGPGDPDDPDDAGDGEGSNPDGTNDEFEAGAAQAIAKAGVKPKAAAPAKTARRTRSTASTVE